MDKNRFLKGRYDNELDQLILSSILGTGALEIPRDEAGWRRLGVLRLVEHRDEKRAYFQWKREILIRQGLLANTITWLPAGASADGVAVPIIHKVVSCPDARISRWEAEAYRGVGQARHKVVTRQLLNRFEPWGLAIWYMDMGHLTYHPHKKRTGGTFRITLGVKPGDRVTDEEAEILQRYFAVMWNIYFTVVRKKSAGGMGAYLRANITEGGKLLDIVRPYVHPSLADTVNPLAQKQRALARKQMLL